MSEEKIAFERLKELYMACSKDKAELMLELGKLTKKMELIHEAFSDFVNGKLTDLQQFAHFLLLLTRSRKKYRKKQENGRNRL